MVDTLGDFAEALNRMLCDLELPPIAAQHIGRMVGKGSEHLLRSVLNHVLEHMGKAPPAIEIEALAHAWPTPAALSGHQWTLRARHPGGWSRPAGPAPCRLACLTNKPTSFALPLLRAKGLEGYFEQVFGGDSFDKKKPDPLPLLKTCEALQTAPARTLMVGDSSNDAQAARAAGCPVVLVTYGYNHGLPAQAVDADGYVDSLELLLA
jgi:phosphoglycolate phosphatase